MTLTLFSSAKAALLAVVIVSSTLLQLGRGWCLDEEKGPCSLNIRSKAANVIPRSVKFFDNEEKATGVLEFSPNLNDLKIFLGGDSNVFQCFQFTAASFFGVGTSPQYQLDVANNNDQSVLRMEGVKTKDGICAGLRLSDFQSKRSANLFHDSQSKVVGLSFTPTSSNPLMSQDASFLISTDAPSECFLIDSGGNLVLSQTSPISTKYSRLTFSKARGGNKNAPQIVLKDDVVGEVEFSAHDGIKSSPVASIRSVVHGQVAPGQVGGRLEFGTKSPGKPALKTHLSLTPSELTLHGGVNVKISSGGSLVLEEGALTLSKGDLELGPGLLTSLGSASFAAGLEIVTHGVTIKEGPLELQSKGSITVAEGDLNLKQGSIQCKGAISSSDNVEVGKSLKVSESSEVGGDLLVHGQHVVFDGDLDTKGGARFAHGISVTSGSTELHGNLILAGEGAKFSIFKARDESSSPSFEVDQQNKRCSVNSDLNVGGNVDVEKDIRVTGEASLQSSVKVSKSMDVGEDLYVAGNVVLSSNVESSSPETGSLVVRGGVGIEGSLSVGEEIYIKKNTLSSGGKDGESLVIAGPTVVEKEVTIVSGGLRIQGTAEEEAPRAAISPAGDLTITGTSNLQGKVSLLDDVLVKASLKVDSSMSVQGLLKADAVKASNLTVSGNTQLNGDVALEGHVVITSGSFLSSVPIELYGKDEDHAVSLGSEKFTLSNINTTFQGGAVNMNANCVVDGEVHVKSGPLAFGGYVLQQDSDKLSFKQQAEGEMAIDIGSGTVVLATSAEDVTLVSKLGLDVLSQTGNIKVSTSSASSDIVFSVDSSSQLVMSNQSLVFTNEQEKLVLMDRENFLYTGGKLSIKNLAVDGSICAGIPTEADAACISFDGNQSVVVDQILSVHKNNRSVVVDGSIISTKSVVSPFSIVLEPTEIVAGKVLELVTVNGYVVAVEEPGTATSDEDYVLSLPVSGVQTGQSTMIQNTCKQNNLHVMYPVGNDKYATAALIPPLHLVSMVFDGTKWLVPSPTLLRNIKLTNVESLVAANDLDFGNHTVASNNVLIKSMKQEPPIPGKKRIVCVDDDGSLRSSPSSVSIDDNDTLVVERVSGFSVQGPIEMNENILANVTIRGGALEQIKSLEVGVLSETSDERLKTDIASLNSNEALAKVLKLRGVSFKYKSGSQSIGLIAQDVEKVVPQIVRTNSDDYKSVEYSRIVPLLVESIKRLEKRIQHLEQQLLKEAK